MKMKRYFLLVIAFLALYISIAESAVTEPDGALNLNWKDSPVTVQQKAERQKWQLAEEISDPPASMFKQYKGRYLNERVDIYTYFTSDKLYMIWIFFNDIPASNPLYKNISSLLTNEHGAASYEDTTTGAVWEMKNNLIALNRTEKNAPTRLLYVYLPLNNEVVNNIPLEQLYKNF